MRLTATVVMLWLLAVACGGGGGLCDRLPGTSFISEEAISVVEDADGELVPTRDQIRFTETEAEWSFSDVIVIAEWECSGDQVTLDGTRAELSDENGRLVLDLGGDRFLS